MLICLCLSLLTVRFTRRCHEAENPDSSSAANWKLAVLAEIKAGQRIIVNKLLESKNGRRFAKAENVAVFSPLKASPVKQAKTNNKPKSKILRLKERFGISKDCSVRLIRSQRVEEASRRIRDEPTIEEFGLEVKLLHPRLVVKDLKCHSWWGPKVLELSQSSKTPLKKVTSSKSSEDAVLDLARLAANVESNHYSSVLAFHLAFKRVLATVHVKGPLKEAAKKNLFNEYVVIAREIFPWFDCNNPSAGFEPESVSDSAVKSPNVDHEYADYTLEKYNETHDVKIIPPMWKNQTQFISYTSDTRQCLLCHQNRDGCADGVGRLVYFRKNEWIHVNCALWSSEVYEEVDGSLQNVGQAQSRGAKLSCTGCGLKGATTGCCHGDCKCNYHFPCGLEDGAVYKEDKTVYCAEHARLYATKGNVVDLDMRRTVHVDLETEMNRRKQRAVDLRTVRVKVGSLSIHSIGRLMNVSDRKESLVPVDFVCSRLFWSTVDPRKKTRYVCRTRIVYPKKFHMEEEEFHLTVDYENDEDIEEKEKRLKEFRKQLQLQEMERAQKASNILPSNAWKLLWPHLKEKHIFPELYKDEEEAAVAVDDAKDDDEDKRQQEEEPTINRANSNAAANPIPESTVFHSPTKKLNKAVENVMKQRTPKKAVEESDFDLDEMLENPETFPLDNDEDNDLISAILRDGNFEAELDQRQDLEHVLKQQRVEESFVVARTWFNQIKRKKFSEVSLQCSLPFDVHVFDMDDDYSQMIGQNNGEDELDLVNKLLALSGDRIFEIGTEERVFELAGRDDDAFGSGKEIFKTKLNFGDEDDAEVEAGRMMQVDGVDDGLPEVAQTSQATTSNTETEETDKDGSPKKDFSIAGLLSPPEKGEPSKPRNDDDDDVVILPSPSSSKKARPKTPATPVSPRKLLPKITSPTQQQQLSQQPPPQQQPQILYPNQPPVYIQQVTPDQHQQQQFLGLGGLQVMPAQSPFQAQLHLTPQGLVMPIQQQIGFMTPQGIVLNQQPTGFLTASPFGQPAAPPAPTLFFNPQQGFVNVANPNPFTPQPPLGSIPPSPIISSHTFPTAPTASSSTSGGTPKKIARVQPQPSAKLLKPPPTTNRPEVDPISALSSMASHPMASSSAALTTTTSTTSSRLSISHVSETQTRMTSDMVKKKGASKSVGTQARIGGPLKILTPRPWKSSSVGSNPEDSSSTSSIAATPSPALKQQSEVDVASMSAEAAASAKRAAAIVEEHGYASSSDGGEAATSRKKPRVNVGSRSTSKDTSIKFVFQRPSTSKGLQLKQLSVKDAGKSAPVQPETAVKAMKAKRRRVKQQKLSQLASLDGAGGIPHNETDFVNEVEINKEVNNKTIWRPVEMIKEEIVDQDEESDDDDEPHLVFDVESDDGAFKASSSDLYRLWRQVFEAVQHARETHGIAPIESNPLGHTGLQMLGLAHNAVAYLLEQLPDAYRAEKYEFRHIKSPVSTSTSTSKPEIVLENPNGCARAEAFKTRSPLDMFSWLASRHRPKPKIVERIEDGTPGSNSGASGISAGFSGAISIGDSNQEMQPSSNRRATSLDLPMAMRFRHLAKNAKEAVGVFASGIHGRGLYCKREIQSGEMVIEYAGEEIRAMLTDKREKYYESRGIGCYMFKIDDDTVVDATMKGNAARFINHACDPNCYSKIVDILGKKHIIIFAMRKIMPGEELTYDYKFPIEDVKIPCNCGAKKCRKYMN